MFSNRFFNVRRVIRTYGHLTGLTGLALLSGCSLFQHDSGYNGTLAPPPPTLQSSVDSEPAPQTQAQTQTVTEAATADAPANPADEGTTTVMGDAGPVLKAGAPKNYVVRRGDTLWGIANMFLRDPWLWPEIWYINPDIQNPHRIYPGDSIHLALGSDGRTALQIVRGSNSTAIKLSPMLRSGPLEGPIATIPYTEIAAFLSHPGVLTEDEIKAAPYVVALSDDHQVAGTGHQVYVKKLHGEAGARYSVMHIDEPLKDPDTGTTMGHLAIYTGTAQLLRQGGDIATAVLTDAARETLKGDILLAADNAPISEFVPHVPSVKVAARVMAAVNNVALAGQYDVIALNRGSQDGLERGDVLTVDQASVEVPDPCASMDGSSSCWHHPTVKLPAEMAGTLLVFKTFPHVSYALIINEIAPIHVGDHIRNP